MADFRIVQRLCPWSGSLCYYPQRKVVYFPYFFDSLHKWADIKRGVDGFLFLTNAEEVIERELKKSRLLRDNKSPVVVKEYSINE